MLGQEMSATKTGQLGIGHGNPRLAGHVTHQRQESIAVQKITYRLPNRRRASVLNRIINRVVVVQVLEVRSRRFLDGLCQPLFLGRGQHIQPLLRHIHMARRASADDIIGFAVCDLMKCVRRGFVQKSVNLCATG